MVGEGWVGTTAVEETLAKCTVLTLTLPLFLKEKKDLFTLAMCQMLEFLPPVKL